MISNLIHYRSDRIIYSIILFAGYSYQSVGSLKNFVCHGRGFSEHIYMA